ncbi:MAG TPA: hypothetical protein VL460_08235 [Caulobacteraceae bacterium]|nr:hypothetical protein [Caulobacteraceae bacterium]
MRFVGLATGSVIWAVACAANAGPDAKSGLNGIWLPSDRNFFVPASAQNVPGGPVQPGPRNLPPYRPDWEARYQRMVAESRAGKVGADPTAKCLPPGMPRTMSTPFPFEISMEKDRVLVLFEIGGVRRVWTDGRKHPAQDDLPITFLGDSVGRWEGDTLVIDTVGLRDDTVFDASGAPHSDQMHVVERARLASKDSLEIRMTIEDPVAFTKPWEVVRTYDRKPNWQIMEFVCEENNRGIDPNAPN